MNTVAQNLARVRANIRALTSKDVKILGVTKGQSEECIRQGIAAGIDALGNNYAQEGERLLQRIREPIEWHFIGHIQSRKIPYLLAYDCIQSLDRLDIGKKLNDLCAKKKKTMRCLIQVNIGEEAQKSGVSPTKISTFFEELREFSNLRIEGLMCIPPNTSLGRRKEYFGAMSKLAQTRSEFKVLSMGMTDDYEAAVEAGATMVRIGTGLFGERPAT